MPVQNVANNPIGSYPVRIARTAGATDQVQTMTSGFEIPYYDEIALSYTGANLTGVIYKLATVTVATLTLSYTGDNLTGVVKS
jgi:hypothetical protein